MSNAIPSELLESLAAAVAEYHRDPMQGGYEALKDRMEREARRHKTTFSALFGEAHRRYSESVTSRA